MNVGNGVGQAVAAGPVAAVETVAKSQGAAPSQSPVGQGSAPQADQAQFSAASSLLTAALNTSDVRMAKVEALTAAIGAGTYNVAAGAVADKIIGAITQ